MGYEWESLFKPHILARGRKYAADNSVKNLQGNTECVKALVRGTDYYRVEIRYRDGIVQQGYCSCPYAESGNWCKHMAAVLYSAEGTISYGSVDGNVQDIQRRPLLEVSVTDIDKLIQNASKRDLEVFLLEIAEENAEIKEKIQECFAMKISVGAMSDLKMGADDIIAEYAGRSGFIDYYQASDFSCDFSKYLTQYAEVLIENGKLSEILQLSLYMLDKMSWQDMDDSDGRMTMFAKECYDLWCRIARTCDEEKRVQMRDRLKAYIQRKETKEFVEEVVKEFLTYELGSEEEWQKKVQFLDQLIESSLGNNRCRPAFSLVNESKAAVLVRADFMEKMGAEPEEIDNYLREHWQFRDVREKYWQEAKERGDLDQECLILEESRKLDYAESYYVRKYTLRLAEIYHEKGDWVKEKQERYRAFLCFPGAGVEEFRAYKAMCEKDEWEKQRAELIDSREDLIIRCKLLEEENLLQQLYETVAASKNVDLLNEYAFLLADNYSHEILELYRKHVENLAESARNSSRYSKLVGYLKKMQKIQGGDGMVQGLIDKWLTLYASRKLMVRELAKFRGAK